MTVDKSIALSYPRYTTFVIVILYVHEDSCILFTLYTFNPISTG